MNPIAPLHAMISSGRRSLAIWHCVFSFSIIVSPLASANNTITVADAPLSSAFYSDGSCLLTVDDFVQSGKTNIKADMDDQGSRMLIHCDTDDGKRLTLLARGDSLNVAQRVQLLTREQIAEGESGMIAWLTRSGVEYSDDNAPRRYVIGGSVKMRKSPPAGVAGMALNSQEQSFATVQGVLEPILKSDSNATIAIEPISEDTKILEPLSTGQSEPAKTIR